MALSHPPNPNPHDTCTLHPRHTHPAPTSHPHHTHCPHTLPAGQRSPSPRLPSPPWPSLGRALQASPFPCLQRGRFGPPPRCICSLAMTFLCLSRMHCLFLRRQQNQPDQHYALTARSDPISHRSSAGGCLPHAITHALMCGPRL